MAALIEIVVQILADAARYAVLLFRPTQSVQAENLFLRRQLALYKERGVQPRRVPVKHGYTIHMVFKVVEKKETSNLDGVVVTFERHCVKHDGSVAQEMQATFLYCRRGG